MLERFRGNHEVSGSKGGELSRKIAEAKQKERKERVEDLKAIQADLVVQIGGLIDNLVSEKSAENHRIEGNPKKGENLKGVLEVAKKGFEELERKFSYSAEKSIIGSLGSFQEYQARIVNYLHYFEKFRDDVKKEVDKQNAFIERHTEGKNPDISLLIAYETNGKKKRGRIDALEEIRVYLVGEIGDKIRKHMDSSKDIDDIIKYQSFLDKSETLFRKTANKALFLKDNPNIQGLAHLPRTQAEKDLIKQLELLGSIRDEIIEKVKPNLQKDLEVYTKDYTDGGGSDYASTSRDPFGTGRHLDVPPKPGHHATQSSFGIDPD